GLLRSCPRSRAEASEAVVRLGHTPHTGQMRHILVAVLIGLTLVVAPSSPAEAISVTSFDKKLHKQTNKVRKAHGRKALKNGRCLDRYARRQAKRMARQQRMFHQDLGVVLRGCKARAVAENVAVGFSR